MDNLFKKNKNKDVFKIFAISFLLAPNFIWSHGANILPGLGSGKTLYTFFAELTINLLALELKQSPVSCP